jgi:hypothetical protein
LGVNDPSPPTRMITVQSGGGGGDTTPKFVQGNYAVPQSAQTTVTVPYPGPQTTGNLNVIVVG